MATEMINCNNIHKSGDVEDIKEEDFENKSRNFSAEIFWSINEPEASVADIDVPLSFNSNKVRKYPNYRGKINSKMKQSTDSIESSNTTNDSTCESKGSSEKDDKLMIIKHDQSNPGGVKYHNNEEVTNVVIQKDLIHLQFEAEVIAFV